MKKVILLLVLILCTAIGAKQSSSSEKKEMLKQFEVFQNAVKNMNGIKSVKADHTTGTVKIEAEDGIEESKIKEKIENIGFDVK